MCGIAGKYSFSQTETIDSKLIKAMCDTMAYRGPDDAGVYVNGPIGLGHRRLSILDLSSLGHQPMSSADGKIWITYNGEIYNFQLLKKKLEEEGIQFKSNCDTEVIIALYQKHGVNCIDLLEGMFAFAIWDSVKKQLFLARDRIGKKPLFYFYNNNVLIFASEIKSILEDPLVTRAINYQALADYFKHLYVPDPKTIYQNIFKLKPGHFLICNEQGLREKQYWDVSFAKHAEGSDEEIAATLLTLLEEAVQKRMVSDVPLGAFLSGGIDSSAVVALMSRLQEKSVTTCSIGFDAEKYDEIPFARTIAKKFQTDHHEFTVKQKAEDILPELAYYFDEPFADASSVPTYYVSQLARQQVTVALSGDGGDENFAGYEKYHIDDIENKVRALFPQFLRKSLCPFFSKIFHSINNNTCKKASSLLNTMSFEADFGFYLSNTEFDDKIWFNCLSPNFRAEIKDYDPSELTRHHYHQADTDDHLSKILYTDLKTYLAGDILVKVDRMSMANSLEVRAPILDHKVIEYAATIPSRLKYKQGEKKYILKQAFAQILPQEIMNRKKMGFSVPLAEWLRGELYNFTHENLFSDDGGLACIFEMSQIKSLWHEHVSKKQNHATILWSLLMFTLWHKRFML